MDVTKDRILSFLSDSFGFRGRFNIAAWAVAGGAAYYMWIRPEQLRRQQEKEDCLKAKRDVVEQAELPPEVLRQVEEHVKKNS